MEKRFFKLNIFAEDFNSVICLNDGKIIIQENENDIVKIQVDNTFYNLTMLCELGFDFYSSSEWYCFIMDFKSIHSIDFWKENK